MNKKNQYSGEEILEAVQEGKARGSSWYFASYGKTPYLLNSARAYLLKKTVKDKKEAQELLNESLAKFHKIAATRKFDNT